MGLFEGTELKAGMSWWWESEVVDHIASTHRRQREMNASVQLIFSFFFLSRTPAYGMALPMFRVGP